MKTYWKSLLLWVPFVVLYFFRMLSTHNACPLISGFYYTAAQNWLHHLPLYQCHGASCFVYFPTTAVLLAPFALLPMPLFGNFFFIASIIFLTWGIYSFSRYIACERQKLAFFFVLLLTLIFTRSGLFSGQMHVLMTGTVLLGFAAIARDKWWQAAFWLALSLALKPTAIVLFLLALVLYPKLSVKLLCMTALFFLGTFAFQSPDYVVAQYKGFVAIFTEDMHFDAGHPDHWITLFGAIDFYTHYAVKGATQFYIRIFAALATFSVCCYARLKCHKTMAIYFMVAFAMCYLMLFNSRTENTNYMMVAPMMGYTLFLAMTSKKYLEFYVLSLVILLSVVIKNTAFGNYAAKPTLVVFYGGYLLQQLFLSCRYVGRNVHPHCEFRQNTVN